MESKCYTVNEEKMFADVNEGTAIVINSVTGVYYGMNKYGTEVFENLQAGSSTGEILDAIKAIPGSDDNCENAFDAFVQSLVGYEIVIPAEAGSPRVAEINPELAIADGFVPECTEYRDVQELLFADPIHEVDVDEGWKPN
jgi:hypothetical protein